jgi:hypothetical protein
MRARRNVIRGRRDSRAALMPGSGPLAKVPPVAAFVAILAVFGVAVWLRGVAGAILLGALDLAVLGLLAGTWAALRPADRVLRVVVVLILAGVAISLLR